MKHLKRFNEANDYDVLDFCKDHLTFLTDNDFRIKLWDFTRHNSIVISKGEASGYSGRGKEFKYNDIKDEFIPFISILSTNYKVGNILFETPASISSGRSNICSVDDVLNDRLINYHLVDIHIEIMKE